MSSEDGEPYIMLEGDEEDEWVSPTPARTAIVEIVVEETDLSSDDLDDLEEYVDWDELRSVLEGADGDDVSFEVEDATVTVSADGDIDVE